MFFTNPPTQEATYTQAIDALIDLRNALNPSLADFPSLRKQFEKFANDSTAKFIDTIGKIQNPPSESQYNDIKELLDEIKTINPKFYVHVNLNNFFEAKVAQQKAEHTPVALSDQL